jgi:predicted nuclease of restriction endonuclease-like (RecB) superfamily
MSKTTKKALRRAVVAEAVVEPPPQAGFDEVLQLIDSARARAVAAANTMLIELYWNIGEHISRRVAAEGWGQGTVGALAEHIRKRRPNAIGVSARNLWRMMQFCETCRNQPKLSALLTELSWTNNLLILGKCKRDEEREFYLRLAHGQNWSSRELCKRPTPPEHAHNIDGRHVCHGCREAHLGVVH